MYTLVIFLIQELIVEQIKCEFLQITPKINYLQENQKN